MFALRRPALGLLATMLGQHARCAVALSMASAGGATPKADMRNVSPPASDAAAQASNPAAFPRGTPRHAGLEPRSNSLDPGRAGPRVLLLTRAGLALDRALPAAGAVRHGDARGGQRAQPVL